MSGEWTWVSGSDTVSASGNYGTQNVSAPSNIPGARQAALTSIDAAGNVWMFGGSGFDGTGQFGYLNDLWKFSPTTGQWVWISGSNAKDQTGVYGTQIIPNVTNIPGARYSSVGWMDSAGNLFVFGGFGHDSTGNSGILNDLWEFSPSTDLWTWVDGGTLINGNSNYGNENQFDPSYFPGARSQSVTWVDNDGYLWLFGGGGLDSTGQNGFLADLWKIDPGL